MYRVLLLLDEGENSDRVRDYLQISGCIVQEVLLTPELVYKDLVRQPDLFIICSKRAGELAAACGELRAVTQKPVLVLSEEDDEWAKIKMFQAGINDYLVQPVAQGELIARVKGNIACYRRLTGGLRHIKNRELEIEIYKRRVYLSGEELKMSAREFDVLLFMAQNPDEVLSKEDIYHAVWEFEEGEGTYNCVAIYIKKLRQKLETDPENPRFIETVWGVGYRFRG